MRWKVLLCLSIFISIIVIILSLRYAFCDTLYLKNGATIEGLIIEENDKGVILELEGGRVDFSFTEIERIERGPYHIKKTYTSTGESKPAQREYIEYKGRRYTIERFKNIIARKDLVKYKGRWLTRHERLGLEIEEDTDDKFDVKKVVKYASPAVVSLKVDGSKLGSGTMINSNGLFITNWHVIRDAKTIKVKLFNEKREYSARLITYNEDYDIALASIGGVDHPYLRLADSETIMVGEPVIALGNPFGLAATTTTGIISSIRKLKEFPHINSNVLKSSQREILFIQTDAAINPGNSGGPLLNRKGKIVGINSFGISKDVAEGLNFAIHASELKKLYSHYFE